KLPSVSSHPQIRPLLELVLQKLEPIASPHGASGYEHYPRGGGAPFCAVSVVATTAAPLRHSTQYQAMFAAGAPPAPAAAPRPAFQLNPKAKAFVYESPAARV